MTFHPPCAQYLTVSCQVNKLLNVTYSIQLSELYTYNVRTSLCIYFNSRKKILSSYLGNILYSPPRRGGPPEFCGRKVTWESESQTCNPLTSAPSHTGHQGPFTGPVNSLPLTTSLPYGHLHQHHDLPRWEEPRQKSAQPRSWLTAIWTRHLRGLSSQSMVGVGGWALDGYNPSRPRLLDVWRGARPYHTRMKCLGQDPLCLDLKAGSSVGHSTCKRCREAGNK